MVIYVKTFTFYVIYVIFGLSLLRWCWRVSDAKTVNLMFFESDNFQPEVYSEYNYGIHYKQVPCMISIWLTRTVWTTVTVDVWSADGTNSKQRLADWCTKVRKSLNPLRLKTKDATVMFTPVTIFISIKEMTNTFGTLGKTQEMCFLPARYNIIVTLY